MWPNHVQSARNRPEDNHQRPQGHVAPTRSTNHNVITCDQFDHACHLKSQCWSQDSHRLTGNSQFGQSRLPTRGGGPAAAPSAPRRDHHECHSLEKGFNDDIGCLQAHVVIANIDQLPRPRLSRASNRYLVAPMERIECHFGQSRSAAALEIGESLDLLRLLTKFVTYPTSKLAGQIFKIVGLPCHDWPGEEFRALVMPFCCRPIFARKREWCRGGREAV
jgi:hypothetical protein